MKPIVIRNRNEFVQEIYKNNESNCLWGEIICLIWLYNLKAVRAHAFHSKYIMNYLKTGMNILNYWLKNKPFLFTETVKSAFWQLMMSSILPYYGYWHVDVPLVVDIQV